MGGQRGPLEGVEMIKGLTESMIQPTLAAPVPARITLTGRILLAEDGVDNQRLVSTHLRKAGAHVTIADNGRIAVELAAQEPFDLADALRNFYRLYAARFGKRRWGDKTPDYGFALDDIRRVLPEARFLQDRPLSELGIVAVGLDARR